MRRTILILLVASFVLSLCVLGSAQRRDERMAWWRQARFGLFIHWGLYAIPAGTWGEETHHAEWIRTTAKIPIDEYDKLVAKFNPVKFDAAAWVRMAKDAGMKYIVITSKHHDGFALYDSKVSDYDVMASPFKRDILRELADACKAGGIRLCFYHSIMDWHHPDYLPRRGWERETRSSEGADLSRYVAYMHRQVTELLTGYGDIGVMWFDGEWESTWTHAHGVALDDLCRKLQPDVIVNNRVDKGRRGMAGMTVEGFRGDFGTPEQEIPGTGFPDVDWETCMTMNGHWGYNRVDDRWKSTTDLIRKLVDIASKGGNFLLNVGPKADGEFPQASVDRLAAIGAWMRRHGDAIYGTTASPFGLFEWGRCTAKADARTLYLHVFERPADGVLRLPGLLTMPETATWLAASGETIACAREQHEVVLRLPARLPNPHASVIKLTFARPPRVILAPELATDRVAFVDRLHVRFKEGAPGLDLRYTTDGRAPSADSPVLRGALELTKTTTIRARFFEGTRPASGERKQTISKWVPRTPVSPGRTEPGLWWGYYEGRWKRVPAFARLDASASGVCAAVSLKHARRVEHFGLVFRGFVRVRAEGVYRFTTRSDDGSVLDIGTTRVVDNDGLHGPEEASGEIALEAGLHPITIRYFNRTGGRHLAVFVTPPGGERRELAPSDFARLR